ncbi:MAG: bifunctional phosphoserine phosphatase/homoserine phosphotransferase ThrH [Deltaproteobacteria bacterium]|nr:bifunctional phosphoserine phosphatase/homoserine phosphotransferase ThrH [Deltaproteobacteria bacterium]
MNRQVIACLDLEGVLVPEIWINVAECTGIAELRRTTRDEPDYNVLMQYRLNILAKHDLKLRDIQNVIATMKPLDGALKFLNWLRERCQVVILSDTFAQFAAPLMKQLSYPTLFCHSLEIDANNKISGYNLRLADQKRAAVRAFKELNFYVIAAGDSYNDTSMMLSADAGIFFRPPANITGEFPQFPVTQDYNELQEAFIMAGVSA